MKGHERIKIPETFGPESSVQKMYDLISAFMKGNISFNITFKKSSKFHQRDL